MEIVEPHLAVGNHVKTGQFLVSKYGASGIDVRLVVFEVFERIEDVTPMELMAEPTGPWVRADHRRWQEHVTPLTH